MDPSTTTEPAQLADGRMRSLDPRVIELDRIGCGLTSVILMLGLFVVALVAGVRFVTTPWLLLPLAAVLIGAAAALGLGVWKWPRLAYRHRWYRLDDRGLEIRSGVLFRRVIFVPRSRIQHTDVNQGPVERHYGLAHLVLHTAGTESASVTLPGLDQDLAIVIRQQLVPTDDDDAV
jgi:membrane protein YdbS with pleckstrin-like domain